LISNNDQSKLFGVLVGVFFLLKLLELLLMIVVEKGVLIIDLLETLRVDKVVKVVTKL